MLSDNLDGLVRRLVAVPTSGAYLLRLTPIATGDARELSHGGDAVGDTQDLERALADAGVKLEHHRDDQPTLVWARLDAASASDGSELDPQPSAQLTFYLVDAAERRQRSGTTTPWLVEAHCWRRGADGSIAVYEISMRDRLQRVLESELETIDDRTLQEVTESIVGQAVSGLYQQVLRAVRATQGRDPDKRPSSGGLT